ncbi:DNA topoisomerase I [Candidatus Curtissbacteria bacterium RIFCSPLOWO2_01_FULL_42_26]|uniref:DNA topoisomerase 1 n=1 Tax=Candidatus Curtissbacteria bacterium RIFCSPLOWO2_01_FULL_42_26 TaxID=1797729 RepID=A0A1F5I1B1_9BACT|nr:MAG: DNA topoisomerase I [Candidatus Curtissbacteria bacterium RIFCSPLOWO2_01_FULL_42_26]
MRNLVIVESPTKARTLSGFLGGDYQIVASMGHVRDLPRGEFGVDVENNFAPKYVIPKEKIKAVNILAKQAAGVEKLWLATDPDREGEAIAWNLLQVINEKGKVKIPNYQRVVFHEITKDAVSEAFEHPRKIDDDLVSAQQARRVLDRLVGYKLSPLLWKKVKSGLSAGRVQSVALRLVVDREREIEAFKSEEYWEIFVEVSKVNESNANFIVSLQKIDNTKAEVKNQKQADEIVGDLESAKYAVSEVLTKDARKYPNPPFTTSTLQQAAANRLGYVPKRTMSLAQGLYEKGLITYMRTDSVNLAPAAVEAARKYIEKIYGKNYLPQAARHYKVKSKLAQEAHEAIRPTNITVDSSQLTVDSNDERKLYDLIHRRMVVCQMAEAIVTETAVDVIAAGHPERGPVSSFPPASARSSTKSVDIDKSSELRAVGSPSRTATPKSYLLRANGQQIKFDGWYRVYDKAPIKEQVLPKIEKGEDLNLVKIDSQQKFTEPLPRYTEATLIRDLEKNGIGRPSTYAPTISTLYDRAYIERLEGRKIAPTPIGTTTVDFLTKHFPNIVDYSFTAEMEGDLDEIALGKKNMIGTMEKFWRPFETQVEKVAEEAEKMKIEAEVTDVICDKCGKPMVIRYGRFGKFLACSGFPDCKNTKALNEDTGLICPDDGGKVVMRRTRRGRTFWGCGNYPKCKFASWQKPAGVAAESP